MTGRLGTWGMAKWLAAASFFLLTLSGVVAGVPFLDSSTPRLEPGQAEAGPSLVCEEPTCNEPGVCAACDLFQAALAHLPESAVQYEGVILENGAALVAKSASPAIRDMLWNVTLARNEILELARRGAPVHLCAACRATVLAFIDIHIEVQRHPEGVMLLYTSSNPDLVRLLQALVLGGSELPL